MPNGNPIIEALQNLFTGSPETGRGILGLENITDVLTSPLANGFAPGTSTTGEPLAPLPSNALTLPPDALQNIFQKAPVERTMGNQVLGPQGAPPIDIASIIGPQTAEGATTNTVVPPPVATPPSSPDVGKEDEQSFLSKILPLLITGGVAGLGAGLGGGTLAGAAGFNQGFASELVRQSKTEGKKNVEIRDPETGDLIKSIQIGKNDQIKLSKKDLSNKDLMNVFAQQLGFEIPPSKTTEEIVSEVQGESSSLEGAPSAEGVADGSILRDEDGNQVAVAQGGKWQSSR